MKTILVIDDENMNRMSTRFILEKAGYNVVTAESGDEGIMLLSDIAADLVLLDVEMPDKNGIETLRELREIPKLSNIRVCFLTASGSQDDLTEAVHLGAKGFIKKPCRPEELVAAVEEAFVKNDDRLMLVIDDETMNQLLLKRIFGTEYHVTVEKSGEDGLAFLEKNMPDIILLDLKMPGIDGEETFQRIKQDERLANIPVIFLTADTDRSVEQRLFRMGAMDFIRKPFDPDIVHERVRRIMELQRLQNLLQDEVERKTNDLIHSFNKIQRLSEQIIFALSAAIDAKDAYTGILPRDSAANGEERYRSERHILRRHAA